MRADPRPVRRLEIQVDVYKRQAPLILVILVLWYLDSTGWQAGNGFYTIGSATLQLAPAMLQVLRG